MDEGMTFTRSFGVVKRHWRLFLLVGAVAVALSTLFSGPRFLKPRYRTRTVVFPVNLNSYSIETRTDQLLQLLESNSIRDSIIRQFGLVGHYGLDTAQAGMKAALYAMWDERVHIEKTRYESVDLQVTDEDPARARDMAVALLHQTDLLARRLQRHNTAELLRISTHSLEDLRSRLDSVEARLLALRTGYGLLDYDVQAKELTKGWVRSLDAHASVGQRKEIGDMLQALERKGGEFSVLTAVGTALQKQYGKQLAVVQQQTIDLTKELTYTDVVVKPELPDKKVYPVRWLVVLASTAAALLLCYILVFLRNAPEDRVSN